MYKASRKYRLKKSYKPKKVSKSLYLKKRWNALMRSPSSTEIKQSVNQKIQTINAIGTASFNLPSTNFLNVTENVWPAQGTADNQRIGDAIIIKNCSIRVTVNPTTYYPYLFYRIILYTQQNTLVAPGNSFWKFGATSINPGFFATVNREFYNVIYDKTIRMVNHAPGTLGSTATIALNYKLNCLKNTRITFQGASTTPKYLKNQVFLAIVPFNNALATDAANIGGLIAVTKMSYADK